METSGMTWVHFVWIEFVLNLIICCFNPTPSYFPVLILLIDVLLMMSLTYDWGYVKTVIGTHFHRKHAKNEMKAYNLAFPLYRMYHHFFYETGYRYTICVNIEKYIRKTDTKPILGPMQCKNHHMCVSFQL